MQKGEEILHLLSDLEDLQMETTLLRACPALPDVSFAIWTCPPSYIREPLAKFDLALFESPLRSGGWIFCQIVPG